MKYACGIVVASAVLWIAGCELDTVGERASDDGVLSGFDLAEGNARAREKSNITWGPWQPWILSDFDFSPNAIQNHCQLGEVRRRSSGPQGLYQCHFQISTEGAGTRHGCDPDEPGCFCPAFAACADAAVNPQPSSCTLPRGTVVNWYGVHLTETDGGCAITGRDSDGMLNVKCLEPCEDIDTIGEPDTVLPEDLVRIIEEHYDVLFPEDLVVRVDRPLGTVHFVNFNDAGTDGGQCYSLEIPGTRAPLVVDLCKGEDHVVVDFGYLEYLDEDGVFVPIDYDEVFALLQNGYGPCD